MDRNRKMIHQYERREEFWISGIEACGFSQIKLPGIGELELRIKDNIVSMNTTNGVCYNHDRAPSGQIEIQRGDTVSLGSYQITFFDHWIEIKGNVDDAEINLLKVAGDTAVFTGYPLYKRSPRVIYRIKEEKIEVKTPPRKKEMTKGGLLQMIAPPLGMLGFTILMGAVLKRGPYIFMSIGMTVITLIFSVKNFFTQKKEMQELNRKREKVYINYLAKTRKRIRKERKKEREALRYQYPDAMALSKMLEGYSSRLYERTRLDEDFLQVNLGYYQGTSHIQVSYAKDELDMEKDALKEMAKEIPKTYGRIDGLPLYVDLKKAHLGLVGSKKNIHEQLKYMLMQLTFFQSYHDLQIIFVHHEAYREVFSFTRWYPHLHIQAINVTGEICTEQARDQIFGSIQQILKERKQKQEEENQEVIFSPYILFVIDEPRLILNHPIMEYLQGKENGFGFSFLYTTNQRENLPENVKTVCLLENSQDGRLLLDEGERVNMAFSIQHLDGIDLEQQARSLSAIQHEQGMRSQIPEAITFFELYGIEHPQELQAKSRWSQNQSHKSLAVPLGVRGKEDYVELNLHEKAHGPHGLVAGTTGSGKSEIVQSYILSLAVNFHPHEVGFLLIDYKGGGMANLFASLPHLLGTITNLDKAESMRAMASIKSELARRQQIFGEHGVNHINGYNQLFRLGKAKEPLPHLFLISDEFAELKKEQPEFMSELVSAARIGRSLGIHLILATQKPSGVVDDQIWTNSKFKLCLKVQNKGDSNEMIKTPDAADITQPGRAYLQVGNNEIYELFQSAWSGATYHKEQTEEEKEDDRVYLVNELGQGELLNQDLSGAKESNQIKATQLDVVVAHLKEIYESCPGEEVRKPWLPSLPTMLVSPYTQAVRDSASHEVLDTTLGIGMIDIPEEQTQLEYILDFGKQGHLLYMASGGYGKSMLLGQIILGLSMKNAVKLLNIYILDLGNSALIPYKGLPHVADYMGFDDTEKIGKFKRLILDMIHERKKMMAKAMVQNFSVYNQSQAKPLKAIVILVDNYDIVGELGDDMVVFLQKVSRDGASLGIYLTVTLTRENVMRGATKGNFKERIAGFNFVDGENYSFIGRSQIQLPEEKKGRALVRHENICMMQLYAAVPCDDELWYNKRLKELIGEVAEASTEGRAKGIPVLPEVLYLQMLAEYQGYQEDWTKLPVGIDVDTLEVYFLDFLEGPALVLGGIGSGKTNTVKTLLQWAGNHKVYIFDGRDGELRRYKGQRGIAYANTKAEAEGLLAQIEEIVAERREQFEEEQITDESLMLKDFCRTLEPVYVVADDIQELLILTGENGSFDILMEAAKYGLLVLVTAGNKLRRVTGSGLTELLLASAEGLVLGNMREQSIFSTAGIREDNKNLDKGYYHKRGETRKIKLIENN